MNRQGKGFIWFAIDGETQYTDLSKHLAKSIKESGTTGDVAVVTDEKGVSVLRGDDNIDHLIEVKVESRGDNNNFGPEFSVFDLSPFTHTIKLEADMLITQDVGWWWNHLWQHDLVFSNDCLDYRGNTVVDKVHRRLFMENDLPNIYNGLSFFRYSEWASRFFSMCRSIHKNWQTVREEVLKNCHDKHGSTDVVYALAYKLIDPLDQHRVKLDFFKMIHYKNLLNNTKDTTDMIEKHMPFMDQHKLIVGQHAITKPFHYHKKDFVGRIQHG